MGKKQKQTRIFSILLGVALLLAAVLTLWSLIPEPPVVPDTPPSLQESPYSPEDFYWEEDLLYCAAAETHMGIDVSSHQGDIDWQQVKQAGVEYAFVRIGSRGYGNGELRADARAAENLAEAKAAGIAVGAYLFSQAISVEEALEEAEFALKQLEGILLDMPLAYDWEYVNETARTANVDRRTLTDCTLAFCRRVEEAGYEAMIYFNTTQARDLLYLQELTHYRFWLAMYDTAGVFPCKVNVWQYTNQGRIPGIEGDVDINMMFST